MRLFSFSECENQLMLRPIKRTHSAIVFRPDAEIEERIVRFLTGQQDFCSMTPIHANEVNGTVPAVTLQKRKCLREEVEKLRFTHLARSHGEFAMTDRSLAADISINLHVLWRVGENNIGSLALHESGIGRWIEGVATGQTMVPQ